jgi:hypothetical protein
MPRPASRRLARARLTVQSLEERAVPAFTLTIDGDVGNFNVNKDTSVPGITAFTAIGNSANLNVDELFIALSTGDVVVSTGAPGSEAGSISWIADSENDQPAAYDSTNGLHTLTLRAGLTATDGDVTIDGITMTLNDSVDLVIDTHLPAADGDIRLTNDTRIDTAHSLTLDAGTGAVTVETGNTGPTVGSGDFHVSASSFVNAYDGAVLSATSGDLVFDAPIDLNLLGLSLRAEAGQVTLNQAVDGPGSLTLFGLGGVAVNADVGTGAGLDSLTVAGGTVNYGAQAITAATIDVGGGTFDGIDATLAGTGPITGDLSVSFDGVLAPGGVGTIGTMPLTGTLTFNGGTYVVDASLTADLLDVTGDVNLNGGTLGSGFGPLTAGGDVPVIAFTGDVFGEFSNAPTGSGFLLSGVPVQVTHYGPAGTGVTIGVIAPAFGGVFTAADAGGTAYTAKLTGPGQLTAFRDAVDRLNLFATGTTLKSNLTVTAKANASDDLVQIGDVQVNGSLGKFTAATGVVDGIISANGTIKSVAVYQATGELDLGGLATDATSIKADSWFAPITTPGILSSITAARDFNAPLTASAVGTIKAGLTLGGSFPGWNVTNGIKSVTAGRILDLFVTAKYLGTLAAKGNPKAHLAGDITLAELHLTGNDGTAKKYGLKSLTATGTVQFSQFDVQEGSVLSVKVGRFLDSDLFLDYTPTGPFDTGTFDSAAHFSLGSFTTTAVTGTNATNPANWAFANGRIAADTIGTVKLSGLRTANFGTPFGIKSRTAGGSVQVKTADDPAVPLMTNLTPSPAALAGDFFYLPLVS